MASASTPQSSVSQKNQEVVDLYDNYVAGGFAPYPVCLFQATASSSNADALFR